MPIGEHTDSVPHSCAKSTVGSPFCSVQLPQTQFDVKLPVFHCQLTHSELGELIELHFTTKRPTMLEVLELHALTSGFFLNSELLMVSVFGRQFAMCEIAVIFLSC